MRKIEPRTRSNLGNDYTKRRPNSRLLSNFCDAPPLTGLIRRIELSGDETNCCDGKTRDLRRFWRPGVIGTATTGVRGRNPANVDCLERCSRKASRAAECIPQMSVT